MIYRGNFRLAATVAAALMCMPLLAGCGGGNKDQEPANQTQAPSHPRLSAGQKLVGLAGAAALYYVYKTYTAQKESAPQNVRDVVPKDAQLYRSKSTGGIYYRDPKTHEAHWLTIPNGKIQVPESDYNQIMGERGQWENMQVPTANTPPPTAM